MHASQARASRDPGAEREPAPVVVEENEASLIRRAQGGDVDAREQLVERHTGLVYHVARRYRCHSLTLEDLVQEGILGLLAAIDRFDAAQECQLSTYAVFWIRQSIGRAVQQNDRLIRLPAPAAKELRRLERARADLVHQLGREPELEELAAACSLPPADVQEILSRAQPVLQELRADEDSDCSLGELIADENASDPEFALVATVGFDVLRELVATLPARWREVIEMRYGLRDEPALTVAEIAGRLGISRQRVREIELRGLRGLRQALERPDDSPSGNP